MASFDLHDKCARCRDKLIGEDDCVKDKPCKICDARCRDKLIGEDDCVKDKPCKICDGFLVSQKDMLATPSYKIRKDKKAGILVSPKDVTVLQPVDNEPTFQSPQWSTVSISCSSTFHSAIILESNVQFRYFRPISSHCRQMVGAVCPYGGTTVTGQCFFHSGFCC